MRKLMKKVAQSALAKLGYEMRCTRYIAPTMLNPEAVLDLNFRHLIADLMHRTRRQQLVFMQIGAFDGVSCDPLREFVIAHGWQGILVEPQPTAYQKLVTNYREQQGLIFKNCAVTQSRGELELYIVSGDDMPDWVGGLAGFSRESIEKHESIIPGISKHITSIRVPTVTFADLLSELPAPLDLLQIDTEGFDAQLLEMFPFGQCLPSLIHFERKHLSPQVLDDCLKNLHKYGYRFAYDGQEDMLAYLNQ